MNQTNKAKPLPGEEGLVDPAILSEMRELMGRAKCTEICTAFFAEMDAATAAINRYLAAADLKRVKQVAHRSASAVGLLGAVLMQGKLASVERACKQGDLDTAKWLLSEIGTIWPATRNILENMCKA